MLSKPMGDQNMCLEQSGERKLNKKVKKINKAIINVQVWDLALLMLTIAKFPCWKDQLITNIHYGSKVWGW